MKRQKIAAGNWKMNLTMAQARKLVTDIKYGKRPSNVKVILGVPYPYLYVLNSITGKNMNVAAQNLHHETKGAYTGEISSDMLKSIGTGYVIIGHSERRAHNKESNTILKQKVSRAISDGLKIIFCCGEPLKVRKSKKHQAHVRKQLDASLLHLDKSDMKNVIVAYEPIWAIGTGETASPAQAQEMHKSIRSHLKSAYGKSTAESISILYGGSVKPANAKALFSKSDVDGGLVGGASLKADSFLSIINSF